MTLGRLCFQLVPLTRGAGLLDHCHSSEPAEEPYGGFIHTDRPGKPSLELDLIEEFRPTVVDRTILGLVNRKFEVALDENKRLDEATRKRLAEHIKNRMDSTDRYEGKRQRIAVILQSQAYCYFREARA